MLIYHESPMKAGYFPPQTVKQREGAATRPFFAQGSAADKGAAWRSTMFFGNIIKHASGTGQHTTHKNAGDWGLVGWLALFYPHV